MDRSGKEQLGAAITEKLKDAEGVILTQMDGLTVSELSELRIALREVRAEFRVLKNRVARKAIEANLPEMAVLTDELKGPIGIVYANGDSAQAAKVLNKFEDKLEDKLAVKAGFLDNSRITAAEVKAIADLPSKEVLLGKIVGCLVSPHRGLVSVMNGVNRNLVQVINAIKDQKS